MKKFLSFATAAILTLSLSACAMGNNTGNDNLRARNNGGVDVRRLAQPNDFNNNNITPSPVGVYRDGVYTGSGDVHDNGNESATVIVRNGRIAEIGLTTIGVNNRVNYDVGNGVVIDNEGRTNNLVDDGLGMNTNPAANNPGIVNRTGTDVPTGESGINDVRSQLAGRMVQAQTYNVNVNGGNDNMNRAVNNWKLAVQRALDKARR